MWQVDIRITIYMTETFVNHPDPLKKVSNYDQRITSAFL